MTSPEFVFEQATEAIDAGAFARAEALLHQALDINPGLAEAHANLAWLLDRRGALDKALQHYERALNLQPHNATILTNAGALLATLRRHDEAQSLYQRALALDALQPGVWCNLGALQAQTFRDDEAEYSLRMALELDASHVASHFNLACLLLRKGQFEAGWHHFEYREWYRAIADRLLCPRWQGQAIEGRNVLVVYEAGHGDMVQFCRYVTLLRDVGAAGVDLMCHPGLKVLMQSVEGVCQVFGFDGHLPVKEWDYWVPIMSLPCHFGTRIDTIPARLPYLRAPAKALAYWQAQMQAQCPSTNLRVGLVWHGSADFENDAKRSLPGLHTLAPLWNIAGVSFVSLQKGRGEDEVRTLQNTQPLINIAALLKDFSDTAAALSSLDLVISVDTAVAHLAGALNKPCWLLLPSYMTDWRWLEGRTDSPWYPGALRLFRQPRDADWSTVIEMVRDALRDLKG